MADTDKTKPQDRNESRVVMISLVLVIVIVAVIALIGLFLLKTPAEIIEGQAEATSVRVSGKLPGRVTEIFVKEGDMVSMPGFGTFEPKKRMEREAVHPSSGKRILIPPKLTMVFKPSTLLKQKIRNL